MPPSERIIAGAMSGTSADGVDVALTRITGRGTSMTAQLLRHHHRPYDVATRDEIFSFRGGDATANLARLAKLGRTISLTYAAAINEALAASRLSASDLAAVAAHGQTLYHDPPNTIQWFDPSLVAAEVGCPVVSDFRRADLAAGGQGAPLVPYADYILFRHPTKNRVLVNIGGIANLTCLFASGSIDRVIAFDTGPGNCVSDHLMRRHDPDGPGYDIDGRLASSGRPSRELVDAVNRDPYFAPLGPKSTDGPAMIAIFEREMRAVAPQLSLNEQLASAAAITATQIARALSLFGVQFAGEVIISGGGVRNKAIINNLRYQLSRESDAITIRTTESLGLPADAKEALAFALLAAATLDGEPSNVPSVTGARRPVVLGSITPRP